MVRWIFIAGIFAVVALAGACGPETPQGSPPVEDPPTDECVLGQHNCDADADCTDTAAAFVCSCRDGYQGDGTDCEDVDECLTDNGGCAQVCNNDEGTFSCACNEGYALNEDGLGCDDVDECAQDNGGCDQTCANETGGFSCSCDAGFTLNEDGLGCDDVDECATANGGCAQVCNNDEGTFACACNEGYALNEDAVTCRDIDECLVDNGGCAQACTNEEGAFRCSCGEGYTLAGDQLGCDDVDECATANGGCPQVCINDEGTFACACNEGYALNEDAVTCDDIDECLVDNGGCAQACTNEEGAFRCSCGEGYTLAGDQLGCDDVDECATANGGCAQVCNNDEATFSCACNEGYVLNEDAAACDDIDECLIENGGCAHVCNNAVGTFACACDPGYGLTEDGFSCDDIDECLVQNGGCAQVCQNDVGTFSCACDEQFLLNQNGFGCDPDLAPFWDDGAFLEIPERLRWITLRWPAAQDDVGVEGYRLYRDDVLVQELGPDDRQVTLHNIALGVDHQFSLYAFDQFEQESVLPLEATVRTGLEAHWKLDGHGIDRFLPRDLQYARDEGVDPDVEPAEPREPGQQGQHAGQLHGVYAFVPDLGMDHGALYFLGPGHEGWMDGGAAPGAADQMTVAFWFKAATIQDQVVMSKMPSDASGSGWQVRLTGSGQVQFSVGSKDQRTTVETAGGFDRFAHNPTEQAYVRGPLARHLGWTHVAFTFADNEAKVYVNGRLAAQKTQVAQTTMSTMPLWIGRDHDLDATEPFHGMVDDVQVFGDALSPDVIEQIARTPQPSRLIAHPAIDHGAESMEQYSLNRLARPELWTEELMAFSVDDCLEGDCALRATVPTNNPEIKQWCPETGVGHKKTQGSWLWEPSNPQRLVACPQNGEPFRYGPGDDQVQCTGDEVRTLAEDPRYTNPMYETFSAAQGNPIEVAYFPAAQIDTNLGGNPLRDYHFHPSAEIDRQKYVWLQDRVQAAAWSYHQTGDEELAKRVAVVLHQLAISVPNWLPSVDYKLAPTWYQDSAYEHPPERPAAPSVGVISENWNGSSREGMRFAQVLDLVYESQGMREVSNALGYGDHGLALLVEENFIRDAIDFHRATPWTWILHTNVPRMFEPMIFTARMLNRSELMHWVLDINANFVTENWGFTADMHPNDSSNDSANVSFIRNVDLMNGYSDHDPDYINPVNGRHLENLDQGVEIPELRGAGVCMDCEPAKYTVANSTTIKHLPTGTVPQINDTALLRHWQFPNLAESRPEIMYGWGHVLLGDGEGDQQVQAHLHFQNGGGHTHSGGLSLILFAHGQELLGDIGYQRLTPLRKFANSTMVHNTVVVDRSNQRDPSDYERRMLGNVEIYAPNLPGLQVVQVDGHKYYDQTQTYRRTLLLNTYNIERPYLIDIFEVEGGQVHDLHLRGALPIYAENAEENVGVHDQRLPGDDLTAVTTLPLEPMDPQPPLAQDPTLWQPPVDPMPCGVSGQNAPMLEEGEAWDPNNPHLELNGLLRRMHCGPASQDFVVNFFYLAGLIDDVPTRGSRHHVMPDPQMEVFLGQSPRMRHYESGRHIPPERIYLKWTPHLVVRARPAPEEKTVFVVVHEPYNALTPTDMVVTRFDPGHANQVGVTIEMGDRTDTVMVALGDQTSMAWQGMQVEGLIGAHTTNGESEYGWLIGGTQLEKGSVQLGASTSAYTGIIESGQIEFRGGESDSFDALSSLPAGDEFAGEALVVRHGTSIDGQRHFFSHHDQGPVMHAYPIESVEEIDSDRRRVHLVGNHGLVIDGDITREINYPDLTFEGTNTFYVHTTAHGPGQ